MFDRFKKHEKWRNIIAVERTEVQLALLVSALMLGLFLLLDVFNNIVTFKDALQAMISGFLAGYIALLGFALSAVAIVASLFSKKDVLQFEKRQPGGFESMLASFEYMGLVTALSVILLAVSYIVMEIDWPFHVAFFYTAAFLVLYFICFTMFYTVSLVGNCVKLYAIKLDEEDD